MKGIRSLDTGKRVGGEKIEPKILTKRLVTPHPERLAYVQYALRQGHTVKQIAKMTSMDPWFLYQLKEINDQQLELEKHPIESIPTEVLRESKRMGFSDGRLAAVWRLEGREEFVISGRSMACCPFTNVCRYMRGGVRELYALSLFNLRR